MPQIIDIANIGQVEFPDGMSDEQITQAIQKDILPLSNTSQVAQRDNSTWGRVKRAAQLPVAVGKGIQRGALDVGQGLKQLALETFSTPERAQDYTRQVDAERQAYREDPVIQDFADTSEYFRTLVNTAPYMAMPGGAGGGLLANIAKGAAGGAATGAAQYIPEGGSRSFNTVTGGLLGGAIPGVAGGVGAGINYARNRVAQNMLKGVDEQTAMANLEAARRLDPKFNLTPAEASGNPLAAANQGKTGTSAKGAQKMQDFGQARIESEKAIINRFLNDLSPNNQSAAGEVRGVAKQIFTKEQKQLEAAAKPLYDEAYMQAIPEDSLKALREDGIIDKALTSIEKNPLYSNELKGVAPNAIKRLDLAKRQIDDQIGTAKKAGERNAARLLQQSKTKLVETIDSLSPEYASARAMYSEGAKPLQALKESNLGRIANLKDTQLKQVSKIIFDPSQTDPKVLNQLQKQISKQNPEAWGRIVRNEMERRLSTVKGDISGSKFYSQILSKDRDFNQFVAATKDIPGATQKLNDMRATFKNLINPLTTKGAAGMSRTSMLDKRNMLDAAKAELSNMIGGKYDEAAVDLITSGKWDQQFKTINKIKDSKVRSARLAQLLSRITAQRAAQNNNEIFKEEDR